MLVNLRPLIVILSVIATPLVFAADDVLLTKGERVQADVTGGAGAWRLGGQSVRMADVLVIRFNQDPPPPTLASGVFIRGGTLLSGSLSSVVGDVAEVSSNSLGALKLKREDVAGAFYPLPAGQAENMAELGRFSSLLASALDSHGAALQPGKRCGLRLANLDEFPAERIMRVGSEQILLKTRDKSTDPINRQFVRLIEMETAAPPAPTPDDERLGPEVIVRLRTGDLIRGRVVKLTEQALILRTAFAGEQKLERGSLAVLFSAGGQGSGVTWLSSQKPAKSTHTPMFDSDFPARMDCAVDRSDLMIGNVPCERGIGVHSRSDVEFALDGTPRRFLALCGIDASTKGRGEVVARVVADGKEVWKSQPISAKDGPQIVAVDLGLVKSLSLQVDFGPDNDDSGDHFDWGWASVIAK